MRFFLLLLLSCVYGSATAAAEPIDCDLLVVGGNESAVAAAVQAARLGVRRVVLVNDIDWLGGQFSAEGVGAVDEWTTVAGKRTEFPRSGMFLEVAQAIEGVNRKKYGTPSPGNCFCARLTIEPGEAAAIFERLVEPEVKAGRLRIERGWEPVRVTLDKKRLTGVTFARGEQELEVRARLTIDASDWGDVIRLSGAKWLAGPDPKARFEEPSAPPEITEANRREMNPLTYCVVLRGTKEEKPFPRPEGFDVRRYYGASKETRTPFERIGWPKGVLFMSVPAFADTRHDNGPYSPPVNVYTHRRLVDADHAQRSHTDEKLFLNWPVQDYPLDVWPQPVADALEKTAQGASRQNIVALTPRQRRVVFEDAKRHALGLFFHLQQIEPRFRTLELTDEFGTSDRLPPKPYVREGLRLEALTVLREQDIRTDRPEPRWARLMPTDGVFGFQFNIDFHPTRRQFLRDDPAGPWATIHTPTRNWSTHTDRALFPMRGLIPVERDGLLGASKNLGVSSIVSSALRLHGQMMHSGQASATVAWLCLREGKQPRQLVEDSNRIREIQRTLASGAGGPGLLLWPYDDLSPAHPAFAAATYLTTIGVWRAAEEDVKFGPDTRVEPKEWEAVLERLSEKDRVAVASPLPRNRAEAVTRIYTKTR
jgi:hypothetical protein